MDKKKIVLVTDEQLFLEQKKTLFYKGDFTLIQVYSGSEVMTRIREERPDLVFMDLQMPDMSGAAYCSTIKSDETFRKIPVVMITKDINEEDVERCW